MTALVKERVSSVREVTRDKRPLAAGVKVFKGALAVAIVSGTSKGFYRQGVAGPGLVVLGRWMETVDNTAGAAGAKTVRVRRNKAFKFANAAADLVTQAELGKSCYIVEDQTVAKTNGGATRSVAGKVLGVEADGVWVYSE